MLQTWARRQSTLILRLVLTFSVGLSGCGQDSVEGILGSAVPDIPVDASGNDPFLTGGVSKITTPSGTTEGETANADSEEGQLSFTLKVGDRFPLLKTIEQTLVQQSSVGPVTSRSNLTLMFAITVDEEDTGRRKLGVRYDRVKYSQEILGERVEYDSQAPPAHVPDSLQVYNGLAGNSFGFWIGADNRIIEVLEFDGFLKRCVRLAPPHRQDELLRQIVATQEDEGFANFIDESIGLLPYDPQASGRETAVRVGQQWQKSRKVTRPLPMELRTGYTLDSLTDDRANILVLGTIEPIQAAQLGPLKQAAAQQSISLEKGEILGSCAIDRRSGLPLMSRIERRMSMTVSIPGQRPYQQNKTVVTTVESFPTHRTIFSKSGDQPPLDGRVLRTDGVESRSSNAVTNANFESDPAVQTPATQPVR